MHVHARMPVETAVERRMKLARRDDVRVAVDDVIELVRVRAADVRERDGSESRGRRSIESVR